MTQHSLHRRDRGRRRISQLTRTIALLAAAGSLALSAAAARAFPGKSGSAVHHAAAHHARTGVGDGNATAGTGSDESSPPATSTPTQQAAPPPTSTSSPPVTVSGGS
jgi:hypothetical protein